MTNRATYRFGGPRVCDNQVLSHKTALARGRGAYLGRFREDANAAG
jgi:hypothetical protein